jgi:curved DNA-binding protein CbpA
MLNTGLGTCYTLFARTAGRLNIFRCQMSPHDQLALEGTFLEHPFAELLTEIANGGLDGSMRVSDREKKCVFYFKKGRIALAVSNARSMRLFEMLLERKRLTKDDLSNVPNITSDFELADHLVNNGVIRRDERTQLFADQIKAIMIDTMSWQDGVWSFNSLARLRDGLVFDIKSESVLADYARCISPQMVLGRFRSDAESFLRSEVGDLALVLKPEESAVLRVIADTPRTIREIVMASGVGETPAIHALYALWLAGLLLRCDWKRAFPQRVIDKMTGAKLELKQEAQLKAPTKTIVIEAVPAKPSVETSSPATNVDSQPELSLDDYLAQVESAGTYYDLLGIETDAEPAAIKRAYFNLARSFHPDHFHQESAELLSRVQSAFTGLTRAHETLKDAALRESYNFKIRKELEEKRKGLTAATPDEQGRHLDQALDNFERGFSLLMENDWESSLPYLARAVHFDPNNARFHAYFGKALSFDGTKRHRAESEMQAALRLDAQNTTYRIMLAEFFIQMKLMKRAEGELNRLLSVFPSNREARDLLNRLKAGV